jgi:D-sedoheptulose 7-phosphate isomerase
MKNTIKKEFNQHIETAKLLHNLTDVVADSAQMCIDSLKDGGKIILFGNGGSAADAQHLAAELVGRYKVERKGLAAIALNTDTSAITSIGNDFGYDYIFERQVQALANSKDVIVGISTSGNSLNVINGLKMASSLECNTIGLTGQDGGEMNKICNINLAVPSEDTPRIQEMHILIGHTICHLIDQEFTG